MFKLVIVEDEDNIRHSLATLIPWESMGFELAGAFSDGADALNYIKDNPCHAVLTDILMSRMSGLEMTAQLHQLRPEIKVVILSGHGEFAYAQQAIRYKVEHYLLKPVDEDELMEVFAGIREQLAIEQETEALHSYSMENAPQTPDLDNLCQSVVGDYKLLVLELDLGCTEALQHILGGVLYQLEGIPEESARAVLQNLYSAVTLAYKKRKIDVTDITRGKFSSEHLHNAVSAEQVREDFCALCDALHRRRSVGEHTVVAQIVQFLNENIDKDIPHDAIAARYRIHPGYLSRLFKQDMGETLSEYLLRIKIEKAAALLKEGQYKVGEIAGMVGFSAASYFSIAFKKHTGCSPREYSQRVLL